MTKKIMLICSTLLLTNNLYSKDKTITEDIIDKKNQLIKDVKKDGLNSRFMVKLQHVGPEVNGYGYHQLAKGVELGSVGIMLLPNTWKINLSYTREIGENLLFDTGRTQEAERVASNPQNYNFILNESKKDFSWIDFYMKPISKSWGEIGFGYLNLEATVTMAAEARMNQQLKILNIQNNAQTGAYVVDPNDKAYLQYNKKVQRIYTTYNIPPQNKWYDGFGIAYTYEKSNGLQEINKNIVIKPDTISQIVTIGKMKTLQEVKSGVSFKTLTLGQGKSEIKYYNFDTTKEEVFNSTFNELNLELIFMKKWKTNRSIYLSGKIISRSYTEGEKLDEIFNLEFGLLF